MNELYDVAVLGLGPSGTVAAYRASQRGLNVLGIDPRGINAPSTVGVWASQLPDWFPEDAVASRFTPDVISHTGRQVLTAEYAMLAPGWEQHLAGFDVVEKKAEPAITVLFGVPGQKGRPLRSWFQPKSDELLSVMSEDDSLIDIVDHLLITTTPSPMSARQLAHGLVVPEGSVPEAHRRGVLMDFSPVAGFPDDGPVTFSYRVPLGDGTWLIEETILATDGDPKTLLEHLEAKNLARLEQLGITMEDIRRTEVVSFPLGPRRIPGDRARTPLGLALGMIPLGRRASLDLRFLAGPWGGKGVKGEAHIGTAGGWIHPATGYSVGAVLADTDAMLDRVLAGSPPTSRAWRINYALRRFGLNVVLGFSPTQYHEFFGIVLSLPERDLLAYLTSTSPWATARVMVRIFLRAFRRTPSTAMAVFRLAPAALFRK